MRHGPGFRYVGPDGRPLRDEAVLSRIKSLAIPPAWEDVWISPSPLSHIQATGRDQRRRKQYRYHPRWREVRDAAKFDRMMAFGRSLPRIRAETARDIARPGLPKRKVLAVVVKLLEASLIRVGNDEYAKTNRSFGLTTMRDSHVQFDGSTIHFRFRGKSRISHDIDVHNRTLARIVQRCQELPGQNLFQYIDDEGTRQDVTSSDVNSYLQEITRADFTAKDFRTWAGTVLAAMALQEFSSFDSHAEAKRNVLRAIERVAKRLGNTATVCRKCYIHPAILDAYLDGSMVELLKERADREMEHALEELRPIEVFVLALLQDRLGREEQRALRRGKRGS